MARFQRFFRQQGCYQGRQIFQVLWVGCKKIIVSSNLFALKQFLGLFENLIKM
jgi:hypothetical protein